MGERRAIYLYSNRENRYKDLGRNAKVLGAVPLAKLKAFYNALDVFVHPTLQP